MKNNYIFIVLLLFLQCKEDVTYKKKDYSLLGNNEMIINDDKLLKGIKEYISKNEIADNCNIHILFFQYDYDIRVFNVSTETSNDMVDPIIKSTLENHNIYFYIGLESYLRCDNISKQINNTQLCRGKMQSIIDSAGVFKTYDNVWFYPNCDLPDLNDFQQMEVIY